MEKILNNKFYINQKLLKLTKKCFSGSAFYFDFIKRILISIILKKPYYIKTNFNQNSDLKNVMHIFSNFRIFSADFKKITDIEDIIGKSQNNDLPKKIGFCPNSDLAFFDNIFSMKDELINNIFDIISNNKFTINNKLFKFDTKIFILSSSFKEFPLNKYTNIWNSLFIKDILPCESNNFAMISNNFSINIEDQINLTDLYHIESKYKHILIEENILERLNLIKNEIIKANRPFINSNPLHHFFINDEIWENTIKALKISSLLDGHEKVDISSFSIIKNIVSSLPIHYEIINNIIDKVFSLNESNSDSVLLEINKDIASKINDVEKNLKKVKSIESSNGDVLNKLWNNEAKFKKFKGINSINEVELKKIEEANLLKKEYINNNDNFNLYTNNDEINDFWNPDDPYENINGSNIDKYIDSNAEDAEIIAQKIEKEIKEKNDIFLKRIEYFNNLLKKLYEEFKNEVYHYLNKNIFFPLEIEKKKFSNKISKFYWSIDEDENIYFLDCFYFNSLNIKKKIIDIPYCTKREFINNSSLSNFIKILLEDNQYYILMHNKKNKLNFFLEEKNAGFINANFFGQKKIRKLYIKTDFVLSEVQDIIIKLQDYLNINNNHKNKEIVIDTLTISMFIKNKLKNFINWLNNPMKLAKIEVLLPEFKNI
ncbi:MAG: hypothetical protein ACRCW6_01525 [Mycoplasmoidaceae bacterium]